MALGIPSPAALQRAMDRHSSALAAIYGDTIQIAGQSYAAAVSVRAGVLENQEGGQRSTSILTARLPKSALATAPARTSTLTYAGQIWIVEEVAGTESWAQQWVLQCRQ